MTVQLPSLYTATISTDHELSALSHAAFVSAAFDYLAAAHSKGSAVAAPERVSFEDTLRQDPSAKGVRPEDFKAFARRVLSAISIRFDVPMDASY